MSVAFTNCLGVLSSVWPVKSWCYSKRSCLNLQVGRPNSRTLDHQRIPNSMRHYLAIVLPKAFISTLRPGPTQKPVSFSARRFMPTLQQNRNTTLPISRQAADSHTRPRDTQTHCWRRHGPAERQGSVPSTRWQVQVPSIRRPSQGTGPIPPTGGRFRTQELCPPACRKEAPNTANYMK